MNIVIIEDERLTAADLESTLKACDPALEVVAKLLSVKAAIDYFTTHEAPDLIFSDIQLGDGLSFEIFKEVDLTVPVIFCTAYDEYALSAFQSNGIDYLLKPFTRSSVETSLERFYRITQHGSGVKESPTLSQILDLFEKKTKEPVGSLLVHFKEKILPVKLEDTALFYLESELVHLVTFDQKIYFPGKSLEELESLAGEAFFRASRQVLVNRKAVVDVSNHLARKLLLNLKVPVSRPVTVSREKIPDFLVWLAR